MIARLGRLWESITEPRHLKAAYFVIYAVAFVTGSVTLLVPPVTIAGQLGPAITVLWSILFIAGSTGGLLAVFPGWWWAERLSAVLIVTGILIYAIVIGSLHFTHTGSRLTQLGVLALAASPFVVRWLLIRKYSHEPEG
ncbi:hypothetical protein [Agromyces sp. SYSU T00194]|uniref:hypothetical protein n=1 Tax=Agromyces chitinivorans TaxID=3158560 RepID=UPI003398C632